MADYVKIHPTLPMPELSLDIGFASDPDDDTPTWTSVSSRVREIRCRVYRQTELDEFETGSLTCVLDNRDRELEPFFTGSSLSPNVLPGKRILYQLRHDSVEYPRFLGFVRQIRAYWPDQVDGVVEIVAEDYGLVLQRAQVTIDGYPQETVDARLNRVCDAVGVPAGDRVFDSSDHTCAAVPAQAEGAQPRTVGALQHCKQAALSDGGYFFVARDGKLVFHNRRHRFDLFAGSVGVLGDDPDAVEIVDEFDGSALDTSMWTAQSDADTPITVSGGALRFTNDGDAGHVAVTLKTLQNWDNDGQFTVRSSTLPDLAVEQRFLIDARANGMGTDFLLLRAHNNAGTKQWSVTERVGGSSTQRYLATMPGGEDHVRIRATAGRVYYEVGDGVEWRQLYETDAPIALDALQLRILAGPTVTATAYTHLVEWAEIVQGEIPYSPSLVAQTDDATLVNRAALLTADGTREEHRDTTSAAAFWDSRRDDQETLLTYPGEAFAGASLLVWRYKDPRPRFPSVEVLLSERERMSKAQIRTMLSLDVGARLTVKRRPKAGGTAMEQDVHCEGFEEDAFPGQSYRLAVSISPADPEIDEWVVGTSALGVDTYIGV